MDVKFDFEYRGRTFSLTTDVDSDDWADMSPDERTECLQDAARDDFDDNMNILEDTVNDEG